MDTIINAKNHENYNALVEYYTLKLEESYDKYEFIKKATLNIRSIENDYSEMSLTLLVEKGGQLFCKSKTKKESQSFIELMGKMKPQIEKYKEVHFHSH